ncbi:MAG: UDP-N-acetylglucosamine 2-epimerase (non-hydrolyzing) [Bacteroidales bacterium]|nr:UDP-N-acetylglucosamine 2-epimerase (non-hydrolyzing) [Bacteroidales bacterium]MBR6093335.1 UDP-N-acetylglucosamine 2-epimerase (non-hydrolyzing) [Bacteroidales bacterium]
MKIVTVIGARPQIIKAAALSRAIKEHFKKEVNEIIVHTGQHYDDNMSQVFFDELGIPQPDYNLGVGSASHGVQTARMIEGIEEILLKEKPDYLVLYGDTNSTLAGAIAASKIHVPIVHIEAGLRSFNKSMPEEINRICCDHCSTLLFSPTATGFKNLIKEGFNPDNKRRFTIDNPGIYHCGDVMYDNSKYFANIADTKSQILDKEGLRGTGYMLCTIHRDNNTDQPERLNAIFKALLKISECKMVVLPLHPRTSKLLNTNLENDLYDKITNNKNIKILPPASFLDMIVLERHAQMVVTDSGGVQKEAFFFQKPCLILRSETEWKEIVECGAAVITDADENKIIDSFNNFVENPPHKFPEIFGDGKAAEFICKEMLENL